MRRRLIVLLVAIAMIGLGGVSMASPGKGQNNPKPENPPCDADHGHPNENSPKCDGDGDGVPNGEDNCPTVANPGQEDADGDGIGDACDTEGPFGDPSCSDGFDNDGDGDIDADDSDCAAPTENCSDGIDNDGDTLVDGADPDCTATTAAGPCHRGEGILGPNGGLSLATTPGQANPIAEQVYHGLAADPNLAAVAALLDEPGARTASPGDNSSLGPWQPLYESELPPLNAGKEAACAGDLVGP